MKTFSKIFFITFLLLWMTPFANLAFATQHPGTGAGTTGGTTGAGSAGGSTQPAPALSVPIMLENPFSVGNNLFEIMEALVNKVILPIGGVLCVLGFIYAGFMYVTAGGNPTSIATASRALLYSAVGTAILLGAWVIANVIRNTINALTS